MHQTFPKPVRRLESAIDRRREEAQAWRACCRRVDARDQHRCRCCQRRTVKTFTLCPERAEHHHLVPRSIAKPIAHDPRSVILVCLACHGKLTRHELAPVGSSYFESDGITYLDADGPLTFCPAR